jgi:hypothetical protein
MEDSEREALRKEGLDTDLGSESVVVAEYDIASDTGTDTGEQAETREGRGWTMLAGVAEGQNVDVKGVAGMARGDNTKVTGFTGVATGGET